MSSEPPIPHPNPPRGQVAYAGRRVTVEQIQIDTEAGPVARDLILHPGSAVILPITDAGEIVLIRNQRYTLGGPLLELPAGTRDPGEDPRLCAARELTEETGYAAAELHLLAAFMPSPGACTEVMHAWLATGLTPGAQRLDPGESIEVVHFTPAEIAHMMRQGELHDGKTLATLGLYFAQVGFPAA